MPTYDYHCETCGRDFEAYRSFTDESLPKCPGREEGSCSSKGKGKVTKVLSVPAISFRGEGFYKNDSRSSSAGKTASPTSTKGDSSAEAPAKADSSDSSGTKDTAAKDKSAKDTKSNVKSTSAKSSSTDAA